MLLDKDIAIEKERGTEIIINEEETLCRQTIIKDKDLKVEKLEGITIEMTKEGKEMEEIRMVKSDEI